MLTEEILCVDDDPHHLRFCKSALGQRFNLTTASDGKEGLTLIQEQGPFAVIVSDLDMLEMGGVDFLHEAKERSPDSVRLILTGNAAIESAIQLVNEANIFRFLTKPCSVSVLIKAVHDAVQQYRLVIAERDVLERTLAGTVRVLTEILSMIDPQTFDRAMALKKSASTLGADLKVENTWELEIAAMLSKIGCVTLPTSVLNKRRAEIALDRSEQDLINRAPEIGRKLLANIPRLEAVSEIVFYQNKNFDGTGLPEGNVAGEGIPLGSRILKVVNDLGELLWKGRSANKAFQSLRSRNGFYDPTVLDAAYRCFGEPEKASPVAASFSMPIKACELRINHSLLSNIETCDGTLLLCAGSELSEAILERIRNFDELRNVKEPILVKSSVEVKGT